MARSRHISDATESDANPALDISAPRPIRTRREYDAAVAEIDRLLDEDPAARSESADRLELLSLVVESFDDKHHVGPSRSDPPSVVLFVLERQGKTRADLLPILGSKSRVSEFLRGKRRLSLGQVAALRRELGIPADLLVEVDAEAAEHTDIRTTRVGSAGRVSESAAVHGAGSAPVDELVPVLQRVAEQLVRLTSLLEANAMQMDGVVNALHGAARESAASAWRRGR